MIKRWARLRKLSKKTKIIVVAATAIPLVLFIGFVVYYSLPMKAEQKELTAARNMTTVRYTDSASAIILAPLATAKKGILLYPGARVEPSAYSYKMAHVAQSGVVVIIAKSPLHLAPLDWRSPSYYTNMVPMVKDWYVAGHSVGGVRACQVAGEGNQFKGLILLASYCANNISGSGMPVLSIGGDQDKLSTPDDINKNKQLLPTTAQYEMIAGLNHAGFGDYGRQDSDGDITLTDEQARDAITYYITTFVGTAVAGGAQSGAQ
jgi:hypothetical protein